MEMIQAALYQGTTETDWRWYWQYSNKCSTSPHCPRRRIWIGIRNRSANPQQQPTNFGDGLPSFDSNQTSMAPVGCKVIVHDRRGERGSWDNHGSHGFYIEQAPHHYRNYTCYMRDTKQNRISNTVEFFLSHCTLPKVTLIDRHTLVLQDLHQVLSQPPVNFPFMNQGTNLHTAIIAI